jgi:hypothetical protein
MLLTLTRQNPWLKSAHRAFNKGSMRLRCVVAPTDVRVHCRNVTLQVVKWLRSFNVRMQRRFGGINQMPSAFGQGFTVVTVRGSGHPR